MNVMLIYLFLIWGKEKPLSVTSIFLIKAGIIENETITLRYLYDVRTFYKILIMGGILDKILFCLKTDEIFISLNNFN